MTIQKQGGCAMLRPCRETWSVFGLATWQRVARALLLGSWILAGVPGASAQDPPNCTDSTVELILIANRLVGGVFVPIANLDAPLIDGETIYYNVELDRADKAVGCALQGGLLTIQNPDGTFIVAGTASNPIPCIGGTASGCILGPFVSNPLLAPYVVNFARDQPTAKALATYTDGIVFTGPGDLTGVAEASTPLDLPLVPGIDQAGCRLTGGGIVPATNETDMSTMAEIIRANIGGQVGAPCGCTGCFAGGSEFVQGSWTHNRKLGVGTGKFKNERFKAESFNSLICGCDGTFDGRTCTPGPPPAAPRNMLCTSGIGNLKSGSMVAFRLEATDRGEPGVGDSYRLRIWDPRVGETAQALAVAACCTNAAPVIRTPDIDDGGSLISGNLQIHRELRKSTDRTCPPPRTSCPAL
jgi:hypothetical protein